MKTNLIKKAFASLTALMTVSGMAASLGTFAVDSNVRDTPPAHPIDSTILATIPINKDIVLFNSDKKLIYAPNIVYTYDISSVEDMTTATISTINEDNMTEIINVFPGVLEAVTSITDGGDANSTMQETAGKKTGTITFGTKDTKIVDGEVKPNLYNTNSENIVQIDVSNKKVTENLEIKIDASKIYKPDPNSNNFNSPGVYRYKIEDVTLDQTYTESGVNEGSAGDVIYLDVYTKNNSTGDGLVVYGYVLLKETDEQQNISITYNENNDDGAKIEGFVTSSEGDTNGDGTTFLADLASDTYHTHNLKVTNKVAGDLADRNNKFPVSISLTNDNIKSLADFDVNNGVYRFTNNLSESGEWSSDDVDNPNISFELKHGEFINIIGVPAGTKAIVSEQNNTANPYSISASDVTDDANPKNLVIKTIDAETPAEGASLIVGQNKSVQLKNAYSISATSTTDKIDIVNSLKDISITGLIMDTAPFIFITLAGIALLVLCIKNRRKNDAESNI